SSANAASSVPQTHLQDKHAVAVAVEPVSLADRFFVGPQQEFPATESRDQHEQSGLREMKVRQKPVHHGKLVRRMNEDIRAAFTFLEWHSAASASFEDAGGGRSHCEDLLRRIDRRSDLSGKTIPLRMHP